MKLIPKVRSFYGRDIVRVMLDDGSVQGFYRSTGKNSRMAGTWLPFDGIQILGMRGKSEIAWFDKDRFTAGPVLALGQPLHRFGLPELYQVSRELGKLTIPEGRDYAAQSINKWLGTKRAMEWHAANAAFQWL